MDPSQPQGQGSQTATLEPPQTQYSRTPAAPAAKAPGAVAKEQAADTGRALKEGAEEAFDSAKQAGKDLVTDQKTRLADKLEEYKEALEAACGSLDDQDGNPLAGPARRATRKLDQASRYLRENSTSEFFEDLGDLARRKPEWVFGGLFVAGLAAARFMKASTPRRQRSSFDESSNPAGSHRPGYATPPFANGAPPAASGGAQRAKATLSKPLP